MIGKLIIVTSIIVIFVVLVTYQIEEFSNKNYTNTGIMPFEYINFYSYLPYDIISKNKQNKVYDFGNDELNELFRKKFKINHSKVISLIDGLTWSKWTQTNELNKSKKLYNYYMNVIEDMNDALQDDIFKIEDTSYMIIKHYLNRYKVAQENDNTYLLEISVLIYRNNRPLAKHLKVLCLCNNIYTNFLMVKVVGVVPECQLKTSISNYNINNPTGNYSHFIPTEYVKYDLNSYIYDIDDKLTNSQVEMTLYYKLLKDLI